MKKFLIKAFIFSIILIVTDLIVRQYINQLPRFEVDDRLEKVLEGKINSDIIITGSSIGARGVLAEKITNETQYSAYNLAYPGSDITFHEFILKTYLTKNTPPEKIILTVDEVIFKEDRSLKFRLERCYPLLKYKAIKKILAEALIKFNQLPKSTIENIRISARQKVEAQHSETKMIADMEALYKTVIETKS